MGATSDDLMDIARAGAERIEMTDNRVSYPSFSDIEEQCATEYDELLDALHDDRTLDRTLASAVVPSGLTVTHGREGEIIDV